jgi:hypothetical protein
VLSESEWQQMASWMVAQCGLGFHPDTDMSEYVDAGSGNSLFDPAFAADVLQPLLNQARSNIAEDRLYEIAFTMMQRLYTELGASYR